ncbi:MAG TPA: enoyl-CoA hydratase/isomerase family protein, partial [Caulobacteraceae bacterium]|nr:enoyl-CoA hydratase/isomerase family protein [Caulobacteraceae bacterium]
MTDDVIIQVENGVGRLTLNRPGALHALNLGMCQAMTEALLAWRADPGVRAVLIDHSGERGFCAGGDIRMLARSGEGDGREARAFFFTEYRLNDLLFRYRYEKPVIAVMDGVTMGGGVGLSLPARFRIATERTTFAMPETGIGLFPDVGGGWFLPRLHGKAGLWLALTGARLKAADCQLLGIATDVVEAARIDELKQAIVAEPEALERILTEFEVEAGRAPLGDCRDEIDRLFGHDSVEAIIAALEAEGSDWAKAQLAVLATKSPQTMKVALRQLAEGANAKSFADNMVME